MNARNDRECRRYNTLVSNPNSTSDPGIAPKIKKYKEWFKRYNIIFLPSSTFVHPEYTSLGKTQSFLGFLGAAASNVFAGLSAVGSHMVQNHQFSSYKHLVDEIAQRETL